MTFKKILDVCEKHGFVKRIINKSIDNDAVNKLVKIGPVGALLQENLKTEWFFSMVINRENTVFLSKDSFVDTYEYGKEICQEKLPFGIAEIKEGIDNVCGNANKLFDFDKYFMEERQLVLRTTMFVAPSKSIQFFHQWQRQRKMWWRKFSAAPGKYHLTDISTNNGCQNVEIKAEYPWGSHLIESLMLLNDLHPKLDSQQLQAKDGRKKVQAHHITSDISLSSMVLNALCDAYDEVPLQNESRSLLRLHRKLTPYKISFSIIASQAAVTEELSQLALYLCRKLRSDHISSLLLPSATKNSLESQYRHYDQLGIPYTVVLNENTLKNGIAFLRSRDTTLKEQVHVSSLSEYVQQLFKNY
ncbi:hypothetical protein ILUMI_23472 [Ignelater luminosus]|uniref:Anticodon-binding domain-containing protein n=1 Tax=Ignelater luminosus TaxID=2038154 RepID=A0A8K0CAX7_IGNLU|nr:hypothetical protein ILUMI_23472 [Ignelater luminosus]